MSGSHLSVIVMPIVFALALIFWLSLLFYANAHPHRGRYASRLPTEVRGGSFQAVEGGRQLVPIPGHQMVEEEHPEAGEEFGTAGAPEPGQAVPPWAAPPQPAPAPPPWAAQPQPPPPRAAAVARAGVTPEAAAAVPTQAELVDEPEPMEVSVSEARPGAPVPGGPFEVTVEGRRVVVPQARRPGGPVVPEQRPQPTARQVAHDARQVAGNSVRHLAGRVAGAVRSRRH